MKRPPEGFHVEPHEAPDTYGLSPEEVKEERRARGERENKKGGRRDYRVQNELVTGHGGFRAPPVKNPFDETLKTIGLWDRVKAVCNEVGVAPCELVTESRSKRLGVARKRVYQMLKELGWSNVDVGQLMERDPTTVLAALK